METELQPIIYAERLLKIADFLEELPPEKFNFRDYVSESKNDCGTVCCAIGWLPKIFPEDFYWINPNYKFITSGRVVVLSRSTPLEPHSGQHFLDLNDADWYRLFVPDYVRPIKPNRLPPDTTAKELAIHIREFVNNKYPLIQKESKESINDCEMSLCS